MKKPFFSIIMPAYNCENTIMSTIGSVLLQSYNDFELIIINDGSTDTTKDKIKEVQFQDKRMKYLEIDNGGPGAARNEGLKSALGQYVLFVDSDDILKSNWLNTYYESLENKKMDLLVSAYKTNLVYEGNVISSHITTYPSTVFSNHEEFLVKLFELMENQLMYVVWNKVYRLDIIKKYQITFPEFKSSEDRIFNLRYFKHVTTCRILEDVLYVYSFDAENGLTNKHPTNKFESFVQFYEEIKELTDKNLDGYSALFMKAVMSTVMTVHSNRNSISLKEKSTYIKDVLNHREVIEATALMRTNTIFRKLLKYLFVSKSSALVYFSSFILYKMTIMNPKLVEKIKKVF